MIPFRVFDRTKKQMWMILNYQPGNEGGHYLGAREDDSGSDGDMQLIKADDLATFKFVDFIEESDSFQD